MDGRDSRKLENSEIYNTWHMESQSSLSFFLSGSRDGHRLIGMHLLLTQEKIAWEGEFIFKKAIRELG